MTTPPSFSDGVFAGLSMDGFIARHDGEPSWLTCRREAAGDAGFTSFVESLDALVMGHNTYQAIAGEAVWPYQGRPIHVLSTPVASDRHFRITLHTGFDDAVTFFGAAGDRRV